MAALRLLRAPARQRLCCTPSPSPGRGSRCAQRPSEWHSAQLLLQPPPPSEPADTVDPPPRHPGIPLVVAATAVPHPPVPRA